MRKHFLFALLVLFVVLDLAYTFYQAYQLPLEGDLPTIVLPGPESRHILHDPFGWDVLAHHKVYVATNRFFAHAAMVLYFKTVPFALQRITSPISSVYAAAALFAVGVQALLLYVLGVYISGTYSLRRRRLWEAAALLAPLFQLAGYNDQMGILDHSITYTFFYAFPLLLLLVLLLPFYRALYQGQPLRLSWPARLALAGLMVVLAFNGAIITGVVVVLLLGAALQWGARQWLTGAQAPRQWLARLQTLPRLPLALLGLFALLCLYSLYLGRYELEAVEHDLPLWQRYARLPSGIYHMLQRVGLPLLALGALANAALIYRRLPPTPARRQVLAVLQWLALFALAYTLLLPLGGYRSYRPLIVRRDSEMPVLLGLMFFYGLSAQFLLHRLPAPARRWYLGGVLAFSAVYLVADSPSVADQRWAGGKLWITRDNACERASLERLARTPGPVVRLSAECPVLAWGLITDPTYSETNARMLEYWGITHGKKRYYNEGW